MYDGISIYPSLHGEGDIRCVSLEGLRVAFQKVVPDFGRSLIASGNNLEGASLVQMKRIGYGCLFATVGWRGVTPRSTLRSQAKPAVLCSQKRRLRKY